MKSVVIIGFGRFGELLADILGKGFSVAISETATDRADVAKSKGLDMVPLQNISEFDIVIFAVPISQIESTITEAAKYIHSEQLIMDICSVKVYPARVMQQHLGHAQIIATHPMFGPDSASKGLTGLQVAVCPLTASDENAQMITDFWRGLGTEVIITTPEDHDKDTAYSQAFTYSIAKVILGMDIANVRLTTRSFNAIAEVARLSANDSEQLFHDMLYYNPFFKAMKAELLYSVTITEQRLKEIEDEQDDSKLFS